MKLKFSKKQILTSSITFLILIVLLTPPFRNYTIHKIYSVSGLISRDFQNRLRNDIECEVISTPISESTVTQWYPEEYENIVGFDYKIRVKNISSGYIELEPLPEITISREFRPYVRFLDIPHEQLQKLREENPESFTQPARTPEEEEIYEKNVARRMTFLGRRLKWGEIRSYTPSLYFYKHEKIVDIEPYIVHFYVDYTKNNGGQRSKICRVQMQ